MVSKPKAHPAEMIMAGVGDKRVQQKRFLNYLAAAKSNEDL
jgi:hypothetical protein